MFLDDGETFLNHREMFLDDGETFLNHGEMFLDDRETFLNHGEMFLDDRETFLSHGETLLSNREIVFYCRIIRLKDEKLFLQYKCAIYNILRFLLFKQIKPPNVNLAPMMHIAVNTCFGQEDEPYGYYSFVKKMFAHIAQLHPECRFIFISNKQTGHWIDLPNTGFITIAPAHKNVIPLKYWYDIKLPVALRKHKPDVLIQPFGFCSATSNIPQLLLLKGLCFKHHPSFVSKTELTFQRLFTRLFLNKAKQVITFSLFSKADIKKQYKIEDSKILAVYAATTITPITSEEKMQVKENYTDGKDFFLFPGGLHPENNILTVLKAFSHFKKWQQSSMKLVIVSTHSTGKNTIIEKLKTYKYRNNVMLLQNIKGNELNKIMATAYAMIYPPLFEETGLNIMQAMQCGVPVITGSIGCIPEICDDAVLYGDYHKHETIAQHLLTIYRDEHLRQKLIAAGKEQVLQFNWETSASLIWQNILKVSGKHPMAYKQ